MDMVWVFVFILCCEDHCFPRVIISIDRNNMLFCLYCVLQNRLKSSQRDKVRQFISFTETNEKTAINCLSQNDWRLDVASDSYFQNPERYYIDTKPLIDKKKLSHLFDRYKGKHDQVLSQVTFCIELPLRSS